MAMTISLLLLSSLNLCVFIWLIVLYKSREVKLLLDSKLYIDPRPKGRMGEEVKGYFGKKKLF